MSSRRDAGARRAPRRRCRHRRARLCRGSVPGACRSKPAHGRPPRDRIRPGQRGGCSALGHPDANTPDGPTESTAEHAVAMLLALAKRLQPSGAAMRAGRTPTKLELQGTEVRGRTLGVVGFGRIGRRVGEICALGLGMRVVVHDPFAAEALGACQWAEAAESLDDLLATSDFVTLHTSLTAETQAPHRASRARADARGRVSHQRQPWPRRR